MTRALASTSLLLVDTAAFSQEKYLALWLYPLFKNGQADDIVSDTFRDSAQDSNPRPIPEITRSGGSENKTAPRVHAISQRVTAGSPGRG